MVPRTPPVACDKLSLGQGVSGDLTSERASRFPIWMGVAILLFTAIVRLWGLGSEPILYFDSGAYLGEGGFLASAAERSTAALFSAGPANPLQRVALSVASGTDGHPPDIAKPGHAILLAISMLLVGKTVLAGALVSSLAGIGTVAATLAIGLHGWGPRVALPAAALLAVSGQHLVYSREPLVEGDALLFATLGSLVFLHASGPRGLLVAGSLWGIAFSCNNRFVYVPAIFLIAELACWPGWRGLICRGAMVGAGFLAPLAAVQAAYLVAAGVGRLAGAPMGWVDYAHQMVDFTRMNTPRIRVDEWPTYFADVALMDGLGVLALLLLGVGVLVWRLRRAPRTRADMLLAGSLLVPLLVYSMYSTGEVRLRHFSLALPWVMLAAALALQQLASLFNQRRTAALVCGVVAVVVAAVPRIVALDTAPSGIPSLLLAVGNGPVAATNGPVLSYFIGESRTNARLRAAFVNTPDDLNELAQRYSTLVVDMQAEVFPGQLTNLYAETQPQLVVPNGNEAWYLADLLEHHGMRWGGWTDLLATWRANKEMASQLRVYEMSDLLGVQGSAPPTAALEKGG